MDTGDILFFSPDVVMVATYDGDMQLPPFRLRLDVADPDQPIVPLTEEEKDILRQYQMAVREDKLYPFLRLFGCAGSDLVGVVVLLRAVAVVVVVLVASFVWDRGCACPKR